MTKQDNPEKTTLRVSTWGHLGLSGLIGEWESRASGNQSFQHTQRNRLPALKIAKKDPVPAPETA